MVRAEELVALGDVAVDGLSAEGAAVALGEVVDDPGEVGLGIRGGRVVAEQRVDAVDLSRVERVPDPPTLGLPDHDALVGERLHVVAHGGLPQPERVGEATHESTAVLRVPDQLHDPRPRRVAEDGQFA